MMNHLYNCKSKRKVILFIGFSLIMLLMDQFLVIYLMNPTYLRLYEFSSDLLLIFIIGSMGRFLLKSYQFNNLQYELLLEYSSEAIVISRDNQWVSINEAAVKLFGGTSKEDLIGRRLSDFSKQLERKGVQGSKEEWEGELTALNGEKKYIEMTLIPVAEHDGTLYQHIIIRDVSGHRQTERALQISERLSAIGQTAAAIAHEIRNPLTSVKGFLQFFHARSQEKSELWDVIFEEINRIEHIVTELLMLSKPNKNQFVPTDLITLLNQMIVFLSPQATMNNIEFVTEFPDEEIFIHCEENQVKQIFINLIKNSFEAMPDGGVVTLEIAHQNDTVTIQVSDTGCGIPQELLEKIGQPYFTTKEKGTGIGLTVCKEIICNHQGSLVVTSETNKGTTFAIRFPMIKSTV